MKPVELLEMFDIDTSTQGANDWLELTHRIAMAWREPNAPQAVCSGIVTMMCQQRDTWYRPFYQRMRAAVKPVLDADDETLSALGIVLKKRTSTALAYAVAAWL